MGKGCWFQRWQHCQYRNHGSVESNTQFSLNARQNVYFNINLFSNCDVDTEMTWFKFQTSRKIWFDFTLWYGRWRKDKRYNLNDGEEKLRAWLRLWWWTTNYVWFCTWLHQRYHCVYSSFPCIWRDEQL